MSPENLLLTSIFPQRVQNDIIMTAVSVYVKGGMINKAEMVQVDESTAKKEMEKLEPEEGEEG